MRNRYLGRPDEHEHEVPTLNMASLPDLIFTVLFFFMIVTHMRQVDLKVHYQVPQGTEIQKLSHKSSVVSIYVGHRNADSPAAEGEGEYVIQLNNSVCTLDDIRAFLEQERSLMNSEDQARLTVSIKADRDVPMGLIADIKQALQQSHALRINYSATETPNIKETKK